MLQINISIYFLFSFKKHTTSFCFIRRNELRETWGLRNSQGFYYFKWSINMKGNPRALSQKQRLIVREGILNDWSRSVRKGRFASTKTDASSYGLFGGVKVRFTTNSRISRWLTQNDDFVLRTNVDYTKLFPSNLIETVTFTAPEIHSTARIIITG